MQQRILQSSLSHGSSTNSLRGLAASASATAGVGGEDGPMNGDIASTNSLSGSSSNRTLVSKRSKRLSGVSNKRTKSSSAYNVLLWAICMTVVFIGIVNYAHLLKEQGNLPSGVKFTFEYHNNNNNGKKQDSASTKQQYFIGTHGSISQPMDINNINNNNNVAASKSRFLQNSQQRKMEQPQQKKWETKKEKENGTQQTADDAVVSQPKTTKQNPTIHHQKEIAKGTSWKNRQQLEVVKAPKQDKKAAAAAPAKDDDSPLHRLGYYFELSKTQGHDKEPILSLIRDNAGIEYISESTYQKLPTWTQVTSMYGNGPKLAGLDQCSAFQNDGDIGDKFLAVSGMFNSGTNLLAKILVRNCVLHHRQAKYGEKNRGVRWQVPWGKHTPPKDEEFRLNHVATKSEGVDAKQVLPAVTIRDPFRWLQSMCSHSYSSKWPRVFKRDDPRYHCPNLVPTRNEKNRLAEHGFQPIKEGTAMEKETGSTADDNDEDTGDNKEGSNEDANFGHDSEEKSNSFKESNMDQANDFDDQKVLSADDLNLHYFPVSVRYSNFTRHHRSLVHLWNEWYQEYIELQKYPNVLVRMEDLLFFPDQAIPPICECAGGKMLSKPGSAKHNQTSHIRLIAKSAKEKSVKARPGEEHTGYLDALIRYGNPNTRSRGFTPHDLQYARQYLDPKLLELFDYRFPDTPSAAMK